jgi:outer membrane protein
VKRLIVTFLGFLAAAPLYASDPASQAVTPVPMHLSLEEAVARARAASPRLQSLNALTRAASEGVRGAEAAKRPELELQASYTRNSNVPELVLAFPGSPPRTIFPNLPNNVRTHIGATLPLYTGGRTQAQVAAASELERASGADRSAAMNELVAETRVAYVNVVFARENARVLREAMTSYDAHLKDARNRHEMGIVPSTDVLAVTVERERADLARAQSENTASIASANLLRLVGLPPGTVLELDALSQAQPPAPVSQDVELARLAIEGRAELDALRARIRAMEANATVARSAAKPQAGLTAGFDYANPNPRILPLAGEWRDSWSVGVGVTWKVLDGGKSDAAAAQSEAQAESLRAQLADIESRIRLDVTTRQLELDSATAGRAVAQRAIEAAREAVRVAKDRYSEGVLSSSELLDTEVRLLRAFLEATHNEAQIQVATANLDRAVGR